MWAPGARNWMVGLTVGARNQMFGTHDCSSFELLLVKSQAGDSFLRRRLSFPPPFCCVQDPEHLSAPALLSNCLFLSREVPASRIWVAECRCRSQLDNVQCLSTSSPRPDRNTKGTDFASEEFSETDNATKIDVVRSTIRLHRNVKLWLTLTELEPTSVSAGTHSAFS
jgi:hypothetical protein